MNINQKKFILVQSVIDNFKFKILYKGNLENKIEIPSLNRTGIELASQIARNQIRTIVLWSTNEDLYLKNLDQEERTKAIKRVLDLNPPVIIVTKNFTLEDDLLAIAKNYDTVILKSKESATGLYLTLAIWVIEKLATYKTIHAGLLSIFGVGVLIQGESGIGKSEVALELIKKGHMFIADDAVDIAVVGSKIRGKSNDIASDFLEVRGIGIINVSRTFGVEKIAKGAIVDCVVELVKAEDFSNNEFERLGEQLKKKTIENVEIPLYRLPITSGRKMSDLIESAVVDLKLRMSGYNAAENFVQRLREANTSKN